MDSTMLAFVAFFGMTTFVSTSNCYSAKTSQMATFLCCPHHLSPDICCWCESYSATKAGAWSAKCARQSSG